MVWPSDFYSSEPNGFHWIASKNQFGVTRQAHCLTVLHIEPAKWLRTDHESVSFSNHFISLNYFLYVGGKWKTKINYYKKQKGPSGAGINSETDEPDSLETAKDDVSTTISSATGTIRPSKNHQHGVSGVATISASEASSSEGDLLALLQLERLAQQATRRDYELLRKQYQRYFLCAVFFWIFNWDFSVVLHYSVASVREFRNSKNKKKRFVDNKRVDRVRTILLS